jgi:hypothetical protein
MLAAILVSGVSCSKEDDEDGLEGDVIGYVKAPGYYFKNEFVENEAFGVYILSAVKDSLLAFNISKSELNDLFGVDVETLTYGDRKISKINFPVRFNYRNATENELKTASTTVNTTSNVSQVIVTSIRKDKKNTGGGASSGEIPNCCR